MNNENEDKRASEFDQCYVSDESSSLPTPYFSDYLLEPVQINEHQVYPTSNETCLMEHMEETTELDQVNSFVFVDSLTNETLDMDTCVEVNDDFPSEENYTNDSYTPTISEDNEDSIGNALEEIHVEHNVLVKPELEVSSGMDDDNLNEPSKSLAFNASLKASACNLEYIDPNCLNTELEPAPWTLIIPLPNLCPFHYLLKPLEYSSNQHDTNDIACVQDDFKFSMHSYLPAVQNVTPQYDYLVMIRRTHLHGNQYDYSKAFDKLQRTLTIISMSGCVLCCVDLSWKQPGYSAGS
ncbi:hypothetical protein BVRB_1g022930 [Beta vulgaris subsp. vulgaris]|uniref:Uncharacterized protein n=1 Tax=Beta vulgaris subsp. vulgaris TaxID=3555 RepID=A0A0J8E8U6_BETVV|nr:hypothetical protein BVRB_1g022930 [Beta vulgaris subsp. vulgaris]